MAKGQIQTKKLVRIKIRRNGKLYDLGKPGSLGHWFKLRWFKLRVRLNLI